MKRWLNQNPITGGYFLAGIGTVLFSLKGILIKLAYQQGVTPDVLMAWRMIFSFPFYAAVAVKDCPRNSPHVTPMNMARVAVFGFTGYYLASILDVYGLVYISASLERIVLYTYPVMVFLLTVIFLGARLDRRLMMCILGIYAALVLIFSQQAELHQANERINLLHGALLVLASAFCYSVYLVGTEAMIKLLPNRFYTACAMLAAAVAMFFHASLRLPPGALFAQNHAVYILCLLIAIFCTVLPSFFVSAGIQRIGATKAGVIGNIGPIVTLALGTFLLGEHLTPMQLAGFACVILGVYWLSQQRSK